MSICPKCGHEWEDEVIDDSPVEPMEVLTLAGKAIVAKPVGWQWSERERQEFSIERVDAKRTSSVASLDSALDARRA